MRNDPCLKTERLEQALRLWETTHQVGAWVRKAGQKLGLPGTPLLPSHENWRELRPFLAGYRLGTPYPVDRFGGHDGSDSLSIFPAAFTKWLAAGKRAYSIPGQLQRELALTELGDFTLADLRWPLPTFLVIFESPLKFDQGAMPYDCILVTQSTSTPRFPLPCAMHIQFFSPRLADAYHPTVEDEQRMRTLIRKDRWDEVGLRATKLFQRCFPSQQLTRHGVWDISCFTPEGRLLQMEDLMKLRLEDVILGAGHESEENQTPTMLRVLFNFFLYLHHLPAQSPHLQKVKTPPMRKMQLHSLHHGADFWRIESSSVLSKEEHEALDSTGVQGKTLRELRAHTRMGHWRKRPGEGSNPNAPKDVWVRHCWVNPHKLPPGQQPMGLNQVVP